MRVGGAADEHGDQKEAAPFDSEGEALGVEGARGDVERVHGENDSMGNIGKSQPLTYAPIIW